MTSSFQSRQSVDIKRLRETDVPAALQLQTREHWNQTARDWMRLLQLDPSGCFAAFCGEQLIGTVTTVSYGGELAWIGMMLVAEQHRGLGIGKRLMGAALDYCHSRHIAAARLDATPAGRPLYESLGFITEERIERWQGPGLARSQGAAASEWNVPRELYELDARAFYAPRTDLLNSLLADCSVEPALESDSCDRSFQGYALARLGAHCSYIGPVVATSWNRALVLIDSILGKLNANACIDLRIGSSDSAHIVGGLKERGFTKQRELTRMSLRIGEPRGRLSLGASDFVFASAGPELG